MRKRNTAAGSDKQVVLDTGHDASRVTFVGRCNEEPVSSREPDKISALRLDIDWRE